MERIVVALLVASLCGCCVPAPPVPQASPPPEYSPIQISLAQQASAARDTVVVVQKRKAGLARKAATAGVLALAGYGGYKLGREHLAWKHNAAGKKVWPYVKRK